MFKRNRFVIILICSEIVILSVLFYFVKAQVRREAQSRSQAAAQPLSKPKTQEAQKISEKTWLFPITEEIWNAAKSYKNVEANFVDEDYLLWKKGDYLVDMPTSDSFYISYSNLPSGINTGDTEKIYKQTPLGSISEKIKDIFAANGYLSDKLNSTSLEDFDFIQSYKKGDVLCSMTLSGQLGGVPDSADIDIKCASALDKLYAEQKPYADALDLKGKGLAVSAGLKKDGFVGVGVTGGISGAWYILKNENGKYLKILGPLQDNPDCKTIDKWLVPKEVYGNCYDENGNTMYPEVNP
jgi:hypothetical protein